MDKGCGKSAREDGGNNYGEEGETRNKNRGGDLEDGQVDKPSNDGNYGYESSTPVQPNHEAYEQSSKPANGQYEEEPKDTSEGDDYGGDVSKPPSKSSTDGYSQEGEILTKIKTGNYGEESEDATKKTTNNYEEEYKIPAMRIKAGYDEEEAPKSNRKDSHYSENIASRESLETEVR